MDRLQAQAFHQAIWSNEHLEPFYATEALESVKKGAKVTRYITVQLSELETTSS